MHQKTVYPFFFFMNVLLRLNIYNIVGIKDKNTYKNYVNCVFKLFLKI